MIWCGVALFRLKVLDYRKDHKHDWRQELAIMMADREIMMSIKLPSEIALKELSGGENTH